MRLVHVVAGVSDPSAGTSYSVVRLCQSLSQRGHDVTLSTLEAPDGSWDFEVVVHKASRVGARLGSSASMRRSLQRQAQNADIFHTHGLWKMPNVYPSWPLRKTEAKLVLSPRGMLEPEALQLSAWKKRMMWTLVQRRAAQSAHLIHATSGAEAANARAATLAAPVAVIPNGVDIPPEPDLNREPIVLYLGRVHPHKSPETLIEAWARIENRFPEWRLRLVGPASSPGYGRTLHALAESLGARRVEFAGPAYGEAKTRELSRAGLFVLPSRSENFGLAVAEALAHGLPVIVTKGAPWQGLEATRCGWWIDHGVDSLTEVLDSALGLSPATLNDMGARGRDWMSRDFSWAAVGGQMESTYRWVSGNAEPPSLVIPREVDSGHQSPEVSPRDAYLHCQLIEPE